MQIPTDNWIINNQSDLFVQDTFLLLFIQNIT